MGGRALGTLPADVALNFHETSRLSSLFILVASGLIYLVRSPLAQKRVNAVDFNKRYH